MVSVEQLYKKFAILADAKDKAGEHEEEFTYIIGAVKGGPGEKRLASQFIARFFKYFPTLAPHAINAMFDLCEDDDVNIRKQAIKDLPSICKANADNVPKIAEALAQLLQCEDPNEYSLVQTSLIQLFSYNAKAVLQGLFSQIHGEDDVVREKAIKFLTMKLKSLPEDTLDKDSQDLVVTECKKVLQDVTKEEFILVMDILKTLSSMNTVQGRQQLLEIVTEQAELDQTLEKSISGIPSEHLQFGTRSGMTFCQVSEADVVDRLMSCIRQAAPLFSKNVHSKVFVKYICSHVLPVLSDLANVEEGTDSKLDMLKLLAEISENNGLTSEEVKEPLDQVFQRLTEYMPLPPAEETEENNSQEPKFQFSYVECLMYLFHQLGRKHPEFLTDETSAERLKDFRLRLQYFARGVQIYIKQLRQDLQGKTGDALKTDENKFKVVALKVTSNINGLIKDLFHNPPSYKCVINLSWRPIVRSSPAAPQKKSASDSQLTQKRFTPITYDANGATQPKKAARELYSPPGGKFSEKAGNFTENRGRGRGWGRNRGGRGNRSRRW